MYAIILGDVIIGKYSSKREAQRIADQLGATVYNHIAYGLIVWGLMVVSLLALTIVCCFQNSHV